MTMLKFPSPCGDYGSYPLNEKIEYDDRQPRFPSPCEDYGSYLLDYFCDGQIEFRDFRPLAGIMVLI